MQEHVQRVIPCEVYSRVVGYYRPVNNWNKGKKQEFHDRVTFCHKTSLKNIESNSVSAAASEVASSETANKTKVEAMSTVTGDTVSSNAIESYQIFTFPDCSKCDEVKSYLSNKPYEGKVLDLKTPEGNKIFRKFYADKSIKENIKRDEAGTLKLPVVLFMNKDTVVSTAQGISEVKKVLN